jgi:subfamily B ATP-binding cassette protein MsbA
LKNISNYLRRISIYRILLSIVVNLRNNLQERLLRLPLSFYEKWHTGKLTSIVFNDVTQIQVVLSSSFGKLILTPLQIIANMFILLMISWKLTLMAFVIFPVTGYIIYKVGQSIRRKSRRVLQQISVVISYFQESVSSVRVVKAFTAEQREANKFQDANHDFFKKEYRSKKLHYLTSPLNETIGVGVFVLLLWYGGHMVFKGDELTAESFVRFLVFMFTLFQPLRELSGVNNVIQNGMAAAERIFGLMDQVPEIYEPVKAKQLTAFNSAITFNNVRFEYNPEAEVLRNINLDIHKGEMVAFVGHSGAGKTTLVDLIPRFHEISDGRILIDGQNIQEMTLHSLRRQISIVSQETLLFNTSVRQNIGYGIDTFTDEQVIEAAKMANAWEFIEQMEHGLDTIVGEKGINLSGGQRQRLSISRAILKNSPILVLDEATSALDSESEKLVYTAIDNLMKNRTVLAIAHRLSTIIHADKIVVLDKGKIVGMGTHKELLDSNAVYQKLYQMQFNDNQTN